MNGLNGNQNDYPENALVPYPVILAASKGDPDAMKIVLQHFSGYIASLSMRKLYDERGNVYFGVDEEIRERLQAKLLRAILTFRAEESNAVLERFPLFRSISQNSPLLFDKESGAIERRRSIRQIRYIRYMGSRWADTP